jgi:hypothetical protein
MAHQHIRRYRWAVFNGELHSVNHKTMKERDVSSVSLRMYAVTIAGFIC